MVLLPERTPNTDDHLANPYFEITDRSMTVPLSQVVEREPAEPDKLQRSGVLMEKARIGEGPKRPPIKVTDQGNGTYRVVDGNTTLHILRELRESTVVVELQPGVSFF